MTASRLSASIASAIATPRPGAKAAPVPALEASSGLELSDIMHKPRIWFRFNPENDIFRPLKTERYFDDLERDIREAGAILNPLIAMPDGLLLEGESRLLMAERIGIERLPVRLVLSSMSEDEQRRRLWLGNLSRFEVDEDTRLHLYSKIWPGYFSGSGNAPKVAEIAAAMGVDERTVKRGKAIVKEAAAIAQSEGREATVEDLKAARAEKNEARRSAGGKAPDDVILRLRRVATQLRMSADNADTAGHPNEAGAYRHAVSLILEALG